MERLILCGGGHVSLALAAIGALTDFEVIVIDDRAEFVSAARFPMAAQGLALPFETALERLGSREDDYFCVLTRGHAFDTVCVRKILGGKFAYLGMIGSKGKVAAVLEQLGREGFSEEQLAAIHAPIGLKIGGQSPGEIAVSIAAELIQERARRGPAATVPPPEVGVLATITKKSGSAPRGVGAWMLVRPDGSTQGSVGGGAAEFQATADALSFWETGEPAKKGYDLGGGELGMVCGGSIEVAFSLTSRALREKEDGGKPWTSDITTRI